MRVALFCATGLLLTACQAARPPAALVYGMTLRRFTRVPSDTSSIKASRLLFSIRQPQEFLRDWRQVMSVADTLDPNNFGFYFVRLYIEVPEPKHTIFLDWGGSFLYNGRAYKMPNAGIAVLSKYFPDSPKKLLDPELRKRGRGYSRGRYRKEDYLPPPR